MCIMMDSFGEGVLIKTVPHVACGQKCTNGVHASNAATQQMECAAI